MATEDTLYLLKPGFTDAGRNGARFFCRECVELEGLFAAYPELARHIRIRRVDFARPRPEIVADLGEENQSCPVLALAGEPAPGAPGVQRAANGRRFVAGAPEIENYLAHERLIDPAH